MFLHTIEKVFTFTQIRFKTHSPVYMIEFKYRGVNAKNEQFYPLIRSGFVMRQTTQAQVRVFLFFKSLQIYLSSKTKNIIRALNISLASHSKKDNSNI